MSVNTNNELTMRLEDLARIAGRPNIVEVREAVLELFMEELKKRPSLKDKYIEWLEYEPRTSVEVSKAIKRLQSLPEEI